MKKLYTLFLATAMSTAAFAQSPVDGKWEFTVVDITEDPVNMDQTVLNVTATTDEDNNTYWNIDGTSYGFLSYYDSSEGTYTFRTLERFGFSNTKGVAGDKFLMQKTYYIDGNDVNDANALRATFDESNQTLTNLQRRISSSLPFNPCKGFILELVECAENGRDTELGTFKKYILMSTKKVSGGETTDPTEKSITVELYKAGDYPKIMPFGTGYYFSERIDIKPVGFDTYKVYYKIDYKEGGVFKAAKTAEYLAENLYGIDEMGVPKEKEFILTAWAEADDYKSAEDVLEFNTITPEPEPASLSVELMYGGTPFTSYVPGQPEKAFVMDNAIVTAENVDEFTVYYSISTNGEEVVSQTEAPYVEEDDMYRIAYKGLDYGISYTLKVWAEGADVKSDDVTAEFTAEKPEIKVTDVQVTDITQKSAKLNVSNECIGLPFLFYVEVSVSDESGEITTTYGAPEQTTEIELSDLEPGKEYNLTVKVSASEEDFFFDSDAVTTFESEPYPVKFSTEALLKAILIADEHISHEGATVKVQKVTKVGFDENDHVDLYFAIKESPLYPHTKAIYNEADDSYEHTFELEPGLQLTAQIYGGKDDFRDMDNMKEYAFTIGATTAIEEIGAENNANARYYNLNGVQVKNLTPGTVYIKVVDGVASKVLVK